MKKNITWIVVALVLIGVVFLGYRNYQKSQIKSDKPVVKIGAIFPLTGNMADAGRAAYKAFSKAIDEANGNPKNKLHYEVVMEDDQMQARRTKTIADKLVFVDKVNVLFSLYSMSARVVAPIAKENKILNFNISMSDDPLQSKYNFNNLYKSSASAESLTDFLISRNVKNVSLLFENIGASADIMKNLLPKLENKGIKTEVDYFNPGERSFGIVIRKIKDADTQAVIVYAYEPEQDIILKELKLQNVTKIINFTDGLSLTNNLSAYEGMYNTGVALLPLDMQKKIGLEHVNFTHAAPYSYDTAMIIVHAFEKTYDGENIPVADQVIATLFNKKHYSGLVGNYVLDEKGQFNSKVQTSVVKNGILVPVE